MTLKVCIEEGCTEYAMPGQRHSRCPTHEREWQRERNQRPERAAYRGLPPRPYGLRCALQISGVCTGLASTWDHIIPVSRGGTNDLSNIQPACVACNSSKHDREF